MQQRLTEIIELMKSDLQEYEQKYQGVFAENPHVGLGNRKTRCVNEATLPIITCTGGGASLQELRLEAVWLFQGWA